MSAAKTVLGSLVYAVTESAYSGSGVAPATAAILVRERPVMALNNYAMPNGRATDFGSFRRGAPNGRTADWAISVEAKGAGVTYTNSVVPPSQHVLLLMAGYSASLVSAANWSYVQVNPEQQVPFSGQIDWYHRGTYYFLRGCYADVKFTARAGEIAYWEFSGKGLASLPNTGTRPPSASALFPATDVIPPNAQSIGFSMHNISSLKVRSIEFELGRQITERPSANASGGHAGFSPGRRSSKLTVVVEQEALSLIDPYALYANGTVLTGGVGFTIGSTTANRFSFNAPRPQIVSVSDEEDDDNVALWKIELDLPDSGPLIHDGHDWLFW